MPEEKVPDLVPPMSAECPLVDQVERRRQEAVMAAWAGIIVAIIGVLSWSTYGFGACGAGAVVFGLYARRCAPMQANACFAAGALLLAVLSLRLAGVL